MPHYQRTFTTTCPADLLDALAANVNIAPTPLQIIDLGDGDTIFDFATALSGAEEAELDSVIAGWSCPGDPMPTTDDIVTIDDAQTSTSNLWTSQQVTDYVTSQLAGIGAGPANKIFQMAFVESGNSTNRWLSLASHNAIDSNVTNGVIPWRCKIVGLTYSGANNSVEADFQIHSASWSDGASPTNLDFTWEIRNTRAARRTSFSPDIVFEAGDRIGVYCQDQGTNNNEMVLMIYFEIIEDNSVDVSTTWSSNFSTGGGGSSS